MPPARQCGMQQLAGRLGVCSPARASRGGWCRQCPGHRSGAMYTEIGTAHRIAAAVEECDGRWGISFTRPTRWLFSWSCATLVIIKQMCPPRRGYAECKGTHLSWNDSGWGEWSGYGDYYAYNYTAAPVKERANGTAGHAHYLHVRTVARESLGTSYSTG